MACRRHLINICWVTQWTNEAENWFISPQLKNSPLLLEYPCVFSCPSQLPILQGTVTSSIPSQYFLNLLPTGRSLYPSWNLTSLSASCWRYVCTCLVMSLQLSLVPEISIHLCYHSPWYRVCAPQRLMLYVSCWKLWLHEVEAAIVLELFRDDVEGLTRFDDDPSGFICKETDGQNNM